MANILGIEIPAGNEWTYRNALLEPIRRFRNTYFVHIDWRLEVGGLAEMRCNTGFKHGFGDPRIVCGPQRTWLAKDTGSEFLPLNCIKEENFCPPIVLPFVEIVYLSQDYDMGSIAQIQCQSGYNRLSGDTKIFCGDYIVEPPDPLNPNPERRRFPYKRGEWKKFQLNLYSPEGTAVKADPLEC